MPTRRTLALQRRLPELKTKMLTKKTTLAAILAVIFAITLLNPTVIHTLDLASLTSQADVIVTGQITSVTDHGPTTLDLGGGAIQATQFAALIQTDQVLKGDPQTQTLLVEFAIPEVPIGIQGVVSGQYGLFFLAAIQDHVRFADPMHPALPVVRSAKLPPGAVLDQVSIALGQVLAAPQASDSDRSRALDALGGLNTDTARNTLRKAVNSSSGAIQLDVVRTLVAHNDVIGLEPVAAALLHPTGLSDSMIANLAGSLGGLEDPRAIPSLSKLILSDNTQTRLGAAIALRQSHSTAALVPLSHGLTDSDDHIRYYAVVGLGEITGQDEWTPAFDEFRKHEPKYLAYWLDWAASNLPKQMKQP